MKISCHLSFDGTCEAAFRMYQQLLGGELITLLTYGESPLAAQVPNEWHSRILHATLLIGEQELSGSDAFPQAYAQPQGFSVMINRPDVDDARRVFAALSECGEVRLPFQSTFWSAGFGVVVDRYAIPWEVNCST